jgi:aminobenzoyl-glutamate transport protein
VSGGFSANLVPGQLDALLFGITEAAAEAIVPTWDMSTSPATGIFIAAMTFVFLPVIWYVTDRIIEPRLGNVDPGEAAAIAAARRGSRRRPTRPRHRDAGQRKKGLGRAGLAVLA